LRGFSRSAKQDSEASTRRAEERAKRTLSFLCAGSRIDGAGASEVRNIRSREFVRDHDPNIEKEPYTRSGFTLVEVIVVIVIIAILAAIGVPALTGYIDKAQNKEWEMRARNDMIAIRAAIDTAYADGKTLYIQNYWSPIDNAEEWSLNSISSYIRDLSESENLSLGDWSSRIVGPGSTFSSADGFMLFYGTGNTDDGNYYAYYDLVTYKIDEIPGANDSIINDIEDITYNPEAGYKIYHHVTFI
jgi:prepilin-type N-terminal cleavage/methylation domain-containing protein